MNFVCIITSCQKYKNKEEKVKQQFEKLGIPYYIIYGNPDLSFGFSTGSTIEKDNSLEMQVSDSYEALPFKICSALKFIREKHPNSYVLKTDEDVQFIDFNYIKNYLEYIEKNNINYSGNFINTGDCQRNYHFGKCQSGYWNKTLYEGKIYGGWCSGGFYTLSPKARNIVLDFYEDPKNRDYMMGEIYEDKFVGDCLYKANIKPFPTNIKQGNYIKW